MNSNTNPPDENEGNEYPVTKSIQLYQSDPKEEQNTKVEKTRSQTQRDQSIFMISNTNNRASNAKRKQSVDSTSRIKTEKTKRNENAKTNSPENPVFDPHLRSLLGEYFQSTEQIFEKILHHNDMT